MSQPENSSAATSIARSSETVRRRKVFAGFIDESKRLANGVAGTLDDFEKHKRYFLKART
jgi:hypothetical protein